MRHAVLRCVTDLGTVRSELGSFKGMWRRRGGALAPRRTSKIPPNDHQNPRSRRRLLIATHAPHTLKTVKLTPQWTNTNSIRHYLHGLSHITMPRCPPDRHAHGRGELPEHIGRGLKATSHTLSATLVQSEGCRAWRATADPSRPPSTIGSSALPC